MFGKSVRSCRRFVGSGTTTHQSWTLQADRFQIPQFDEGVDPTPVHRSDIPDGCKESNNVSQVASFPSFLYHEAVPSINDWWQIGSITDAIVNVKHCETTPQMVEINRKTLHGFVNDSRCNQSGRSDGGIEVYFQQKPSVRLRHIPWQVL